MKENKREEKDLELDKDLEPTEGARADGSEGADLANWTSGQLTESTAR